jgi:hypothetical protein
MIVQDILDKVKEEAIIKDDCLRIEQEKVRHEEAENWVIKTIEDIDSWSYKI